MGHSISKIKPLKISKDNIHFITKDKIVIGKPFSAKTNLFTFEEDISNECFNILHDIDINGGDTVFYHYESNILAIKDHKSHTVFSSRKVSPTSYGWQLCE